MWSNDGEDGGTGKSDEVNTRVSCLRRKNKGIVSAVFTFRPSNSNEKCRLGRPAQRQTTRLRPRSASKSRLRNTPANVSVCLRPLPRLSSTILNHYIITPLPSSPILSYPPLSQPYSTILNYTQLYSTTPQPRSDLTN